MFQSFLLMFAYLTLTTRPTVGLEAKEWLMGVGVTFRSFSFRASVQEGE